MGFTWEHDAHLYFRRAQSTAILHGDSGFQRRVLADRLGF
jgi:alkylation response protein AidB-like acyl-CoA dehydrogenase